MNSHKNLFLKRFLLNLSSIILILLAAASFADDAGGESIVSLPYQNDFENGSLNGLTGAGWEVYSDTGNNVASPSDSGRDLYLLADMGTDFTAEFKIKRVSTNGWPSLIDFGPETSQGSPLQETIQIYGDKITLGHRGAADGSVSVIYSSYNVVFTDNTWYSIRVEITGGTQYLISVDGTQVIDHTFSSPTSYGMMKFESEPEASLVNYIDDISVARK